MCPGGWTRQAEPCKCKEVESSFSGWICRALCIRLGKMQPDGLAKCVWIRWASRARWCQSFPGRQDLVYPGRCCGPQPQWPEGEARSVGAG